jgi:TRAP transporter TatT component family protein
MQRANLVVPLLVMSLGFAAHGMTADEAVALFQGNEIMIALSDEGLATLEEMIDAFREELGIEGGVDEASEASVMALDLPAAQASIVGLLSQTLYVMADVFLVELIEAQTVFVRGKHWGLKALRMDPDFLIIESRDGFNDAVAASEDLASLYWAAANWMRAAQYSPLEAVFTGVPEKTEAMLLRCMELDGTYANYGPFASLGAFWSGLPRLPGGYYRKDFSKSLFFFCGAIDEPELCTEFVCADCPSYAPGSLAEYGFFHNWVLFVEFYLMQMGAWPDAQRILEEVLSKPIGDQYPLYNGSSQAKARQLLDVIEQRSK